MLWEYITAEKKLSYSIQKMNTLNCAPSRLTFLKKSVTFHKDTITIFFHMQIYFCMPRCTMNCVVFSWCLKLVASTVVLTCATYNSTHTVLMTDFLHNTEKHTCVMFFFFKSKYTLYYQYVCKAIKAQNAIG